MTKASSYRFYDNGNDPSNQRKIGTEIFRVKISDTKIKVHKSQLIKTATSGVIKEATLSETTYSLHENKSGEKYVARYNKYDDGKIGDTSLAALVEGSLFAYPHMYSEVTELVEKTIQSWFKGTPNGHKLTAGGMLFPALRMMQVPPHKKVVAALAVIHDNYGIALKPLRETSSWLSFLMELCSPTAKRIKDAEFIHEYTEELLPLAVMNLGTSLSAIALTDEETLLKIRNSFTSDDLQYLYFMFKHLPAKKREEALETLLNVVHVQTNRKRLRSVTSWRYEAQVMGLKRVPQKLRSQFAQKLLTRLHSIHKGLLQTEMVDSVQVSTDFMNVFRHWYAQAVLEPSLKTEMTLDCLGNRSQELVGTSLVGNSFYSTFISQNNATFCVLHETPELTSDALTNLRKILEKHPARKGLGSDCREENGYVDDEGEFQIAFGDLYSLDDIMEIIEEGVTVVDEWLLKLDREITPANRLSFLTLNSEERYYKDSWALYDLGVTDPVKITALKAAEMFDKDEVLTYNALPDDMFYELLALQTGESV